MKIHWKKMSLVAVTCLLAVLTGCSGGGGGGGSGGEIWGGSLTGKLGGTAATGTPMANATITFRDSSGKTGTTTTDATGVYSNFDVSGWKSPVLMKITSAGKTYFSIAGTSGTCNIHPFTDVIIKSWFTAKGKNLTTDFDNYGTSSLAITAPTQQEINTIKEVVKTVIIDYLKAASITTANFDLVTTPFTANSTGFDSVLDGTTVTTTASTLSVTVTPSSALGTAVTAQGGSMTSAMSNMNNVLASDTTAPTAPTVLTATAVRTKVNLSWTAATDNIVVVGYNVYRDGTKIGTTAGLTYADAGLAAGTTYSYSIIAFDAAGNKSPSSSAATATATSPQTVSSKFLVANSSVSMSWGFDGTNYLFGIENHAFGNNSTAGNKPMGAQMVSSSGAKAGSLIATGGTGIADSIAFDGTNYLMVWEQQIDPPGSVSAGSFELNGLFVNKSGEAVGSLLTITTSGIWFDGMDIMAFGNGKYLVTYTRLINPSLGETSANRYVAGVIIDPNATTKVGSEFRISTGYGARSSVTFDGTNFFVVWGEDQYDKEVRGRFVSPAGVMGTEISVNASTYNSDNPVTVAFDGTNYLVVWNDEIPTGVWHAFGQRVSTTGALVGSVINIANDTGLSQMATSVACDGINYLVVYSDMTNFTNWDMYGQYVAKDGTLPSAKFAINTDPGNQMGGAGFANGKYMVIINSGVIMGNGGASVAGNVYGAFIVP